MFWYHSWLAAGNIHLESMCAFFFECGYDATQGDRDLLCSSKQMGESWIGSVHPRPPFTSTRPPCQSCWEWYRTSTLEAIRTTWAKAKYNQFYQSHPTIASDQLFGRVGTVVRKYKGPRKRPTIQAFDNFMTLRLYILVLAFSAIVFGTI